MQNQLVQFNIEIEIKDDKLQDFSALAREICEMVEREEKGTRNYQWFMSSDKKRCVMTEGYEDSNSAAAHLKGPAVSSILPKIMALSTIRRFEVYGDASSELRGILESFRPTYHEQHAGFSRS